MKTKIVKPNEIETIIKYLNSGKVIAFKTDTVYGFSCSAKDENACKKIVEMKGRENKPMLLLVGEKTDYKKYVKTNSTAEKLIQNFWPGALTIIFEQNFDFNEYITCGKNTIGVRMPKDDLCEKILCGIDYPIVSTSANISGENQLNSASEILEKFDGKVDLIVDSGVCTNFLPSTIVLTNKNDVTILREGVILKTEIEKVLRSE